MAYVYMLISRYFCKPKQGLKDVHCHLQIRTERAGASYTG